MQGSQTDGIPWEANMKFAVVSQQAIVIGQGIIRREVIKSTGKDVCKSRLRIENSGAKQAPPQRLGLTSTQIQSLFRSYGNRF